MGRSKTEVERGWREAIRWALLVFGRPLSDEGLVARVQAIAAARSLPKPTRSDVVRLARAWAEVDAPKAGWWALAAWRGSSQWSVLGSGGSARTSDVTVAARTVIGSRARRAGVRRAARGGGRPAERKRRKAEPVRPAREAPPVSAPVAGKLSGRDAVARQVLLEAGEALRSGELTLRLNERLEALGSSLEPVWSTWVHAAARRGVLRRATGGRYGLPEWGVEGVAPTVRVGGAPAAAPREEPARVPVAGLSEEARVAVREVLEEAERALDAEEVWQRVRVRGLAEGPADVRAVTRGLLQMVQEGRLVRLGERWFGLGGWGVERLPVSGSVGSGWEPRWGGRPGIPGRRQSRRERRAREKLVPEKRAKARLQAAREAIEEAGAALDARGLWERAGAKLPAWDGWRSLSALRSWLQEVVREGYLVRVARGVYGLPSPHGHRAGTRPAARRVHARRVERGE